MNGTAKHERTVRGRIDFPSLADHQQNWQSYPAQSNTTHIIVRPKTYPTLVIRASDASLPRLCFVTMHSTLRWACLMSLSLISGTFTASTFVDDFLGSVLATQKEPPLMYSTYGEFDAVINCILECQLIAPFPSLPIHPYLLPNLCATL